LKKESVAVTEMINVNHRLQESPGVELLHLKKKLSEKDQKLKELKKETRRIIKDLDSAYKEIRQNQEELIIREKLNVAGGLASGIGHEIRDTLNFITMSVQHIHNKFSPGDERREFTEAILDKVEELNNIASELILFAQPHETNVKKCDIHSLLDRVLNLVKFKCVVQNVKIIRTYATELPLVTVDEVRIEKIFLNIIDNSLWAMLDGGNLIIITQKSDRKNCIEIQISDTGCGIPEKDLSRIFDPFYTKKKNGTGLGLPIVKKIIEEHRGFISVFSQRNKGTTFTIDLPVVQKNAKKTGPP